MYKMRKTNIKIEMNDIINFEKECDIKLPEQYINFLLECNGGYTEKELFKAENGIEYVANEFYGIGDMKCNLKWIFENRDEIPEEFTPIADDPAGNQICIGIDGEYFGQVYFWIHDEVPDEDDNMSTMIFVSNSLEEFFDNLYEDEEDDYDEDEEV